MITVNHGKYRRHLFIRETVQSLAPSKIMKITTVVIPPSVEAILNAFDHCELRVVKFKGKSKLNYICDSAFYGTKINRIVLPESLEYIGSNSFGQCKELTSVTFEGESKLKKIMGHAFSYSNLQTFDFPQSLEYIQCEIFEGCQSLQPVHFPENCKLTEITSNLFRKLNIQSIVIPASVKYIGTTAFEECNLTSISFQEGSELKIIGNKAFYKAKIQHI